MEEVKIINSNNQNDQDFINNNPKLKESFENIYDEWNEEHIRNNLKISIRSPKLIKKYKDQLELIDEEWKYSYIRFTSEDLFEEYKDQIFSIRIVDNQVVAIAIGWKVTRGNFFYISHVRGSKTNKGGCPKVIGKILDNWWNKEDLQFYNNYYVILIVLIDNKPAITCYKKFGFEFNHSTLDTKNNTKHMNLRKESYIKNFLLPTSIQNLALDSSNKNKKISLSFSTDRLSIIQNIKKYLL